VRIALDVNLLPYADGGVTIANPFATRHHPLLASALRGS
jgi:hypothetical protein